MAAGIYRIINLTNGKSYVGSAARLDRREVNHWFHLKRGTHRNSHLQRAFSKYGRDSFRFEILEEIRADGEALRAALIEREQVWIDKIGSRGAGGYNLRIRAETNLGIKLAPEHAARIAASKTGKKRGPLSPEWRRRIGAAAKIALANPAVRAKMSAAQKRWKRTPEVIEKWASKLRGKPLSTERRQEITERVRRWAQTPEGRQHLLKNARLGSVGRSRDSNGRFLPKTLNGDYLTGSGDSV